MRVFFCFFGREACAAKNCRDASLFVACAKMAAVSFARIKNSIKMTKMPITIIIFALKKSGRIASRRIWIRRKNIRVNVSFVFPLAISQSARHFFMYFFPFKFLNFPSKKRRQQKVSASEKKKKRKNSRIRGYCRSRLSAFRTAARSAARLAKRYHIVFFIFSLFSNILASLLLLTFIRE